MVPPRRLISAILKPAKVRLQDVEEQKLSLVNSLIGKSGVIVLPHVEEGSRPVCGGSIVRPRLVERHATIPSVRPFHVVQILAD